MIPPTWSSLSSAPELSPWWNSPFELFYWTFLRDSKPLRSCEVPLPPGFAGRREWPAFVILCSDEPRLSMFLVSSLSLPCCSWPQNFCGFVHRCVQIHTQIFCLEKLVKCVRDILTKSWAVFWWLEINQRTAKLQPCLLSSTSWWCMLLSHFSLLFSRSLGHRYFLEKILLLWWDYAFTDSSGLFFVLVSQVPSFFLDFLFSHFCPGCLPAFLASPNISSILETPLSWR